MNVLSKAEVRFVGFATFISLIVAGFWTLIFYPAIITFDGWSMWQQALDNSYMTWYPPIMPMLMHATLYLPKSVASFSFLQSTLFTFSLLFILRTIITSNRLFIVAAASMLVALPSLWLYQVTLFNNVWVVTFSMFAASFIIKAIETRKRNKIFIASVFLSVAIAFRHEAFFYLIIPIFVLQFFYSLPVTRKQLGKRFIDAILIFFISIAPARFIERLPTVELHNKPTSVMLINQYFGTIHYAQKESMSTSALANERQSFDKKFGDGSFDKVLSLYDCTLPGMPPVSIETLLKSKSFVLEKVGSMAFQYPRAFLNHRLCNLSALLQISAIEYHTPPPSQRLNAQTKEVFQNVLQTLDSRPKSRLPQLHRQIIQTVRMTTGHPWFHWLYRHYIFISLAALLLLMGLHFRCWAIAIPAIFSISGLAAYLIIDCNSHARYLLPSYIFSWITLFAFLDYLIHHQFSVRAKDLTQNKL